MEVLIFEFQFFNKILSILSRWYKINSTFRFNYNNILKHTWTFNMHTKDFKIQNIKSNSIYIY